MKTIMDIYKKYGIPENLQQHMLRVAACAELICDHYNGPEINKESLIKILLLHDMGNLVKMVERIDDPIYQANREKYEKLYGNDDHLVSEAIAKELGFTKEEIDIMNEKTFMNNRKTMNGESFEIKIGAYCDQRVAPNGVYSLEKRMSEGKERYKNRPGTSFNNPKTDDMIECAKEIEKQIMQYCNIEPEDINDQAIKSYRKNLTRYQLK